ncbi:MAG: Rnase Y domain-containing protein [Saprospiraceae bacterium]|nr:Rnase Y domain-containing protein [Saprospiraceae bacterium]
MDIGLIIGSIIAGLVLGFVVAQMISRRIQQKKLEEANLKTDLQIKEARLTAKRIIDEAELQAKQYLANSEAKNETIKQKKIQEAKERFAKLKSEFENQKASQLLELKDREFEVKASETTFLQKQEKFQEQVQAVDKQMAELEHKNAEIVAIRENLEKQLKILAKRKEELDRANEKRIKELETIARMSEQEAKEQLLEAVKAKAETESMAIVKETIEQAKVTANKEAKKIVIQSIQRMCAEYTIENTVSVFNLESDDLKGQIIGREGRNIRALEAATGAEIVVDDTPEAIVISSFDPIRREVCRLALKKLVADGRIHPARIEEVVAKTRKQLDEQIIEIGERTVIDLDLHGLDPYLVKMVGRMRFRSSYGQNLLKHSIETAQLCAIMSAEL